MHRPESDAHMGLLVFMPAAVGTCFVSCMILSLMHTCSLLDSNLISAAAGVSFLWCIILSLMQGKYDAQAQEESQEESKEE